MMRQPKVKGMKEAIKTIMRRTLRDEIEWERAPSQAPYDFEAEIAGRRVQIFENRLKLGDSESGTWNYSSNFVGDLHNVIRGKMRPDFVDDFINDLTNETE